MLCGMVLNVMMTTMPTTLVSIPLLTVQYVILSTNYSASDTSECSYSRLDFGRTLSVLRHDVAGHDTHDQLV